MPFHLAGDASHRYSNAGSESPTSSIHIGLINNMPDGALKATERQFLNLLDSAAKGLPVFLSLYALPDVPRSEWGRRHISHSYSSIENLWSSHLDGLIVTGTEPRASDLTGEPYWGNLTKVLEWAEQNTVSAVWSCLAAHAAILHLDGIGRLRLADKRFGVFECARVSDHPFAAGLPPSLPMPHSRWNDIPANELAACGYHVLTRTQDGSVDAFVKQRKSLFVFFQGHPEYEADTLLLEYRRDVGAYLSGERDAYPPLPHGYFDQATAQLLTRLRDRALSSRLKELLEDFPAVQVEKGIADTWRSVATQVYGNWLAYLCAEKERRLTRKNPGVLVLAREAG